MNLFDGTLVVVILVVFHREVCGGQSKTFLRNNFSKDQAARSFFPSNYKRFRRGYGAKEEPEHNNFAPFQEQSSDAQAFGTFRNVGLQKGGSRSFTPRKTPGFNGGPDAFLSSDRDEEDVERSSDAFQFANPSAGFGSFGNPQNKWGNSFSKGRSKGGGAKIPNNIPPAANNFGNPGRFNVDGQPFGGNAPFVSPMTVGSPGNFYSKFGNTNMMNKPTFGAGQNAFKPDLQPTGKEISFGGQDFETERAGPSMRFFEGLENGGDGNGMTVGKNGIHFPDGLNNNNLLESFSELNADELNALFKQLESSATTTTKKPNRVILDEDRDKIFSGGAKNKQKETSDAIKKRSKISSMFRSSSGDDGPSLQDECGDPPTPINARIRCTTYSGCRVDCLPNHRMSNGDTAVYLSCLRSQWVINGADSSEIPICEPICDPACQNDGICLSPNVCSCSDEWEGPACDQPKTSMRIKCSDRPPTPLNSRIFCGEDECIARCVEGYEFGDGFSRMTFKCLAGTWTLKSKFFDSPRDCKPICDPECINGGICLAPDVCECSSDYRGPICQYPITNCDPLSLGFNGGHNCSGEGMNFGCNFFCPEGVNFTFPASDFYKCDYVTSSWSPTPVPECDYGFLQPNLFDIKPIESYEKYVQPHPGVCFSWSGAHYKTFDGKIYSFGSSCPYILLQDVVLGTFTINLVPEEQCIGQPNCKMNIKIFTEGDEYLLQSSNSQQPILIYEETSLAIPGQINGLVFEKVAHFVAIKFTGLGLVIKWDMNSFLSVEISQQLWNRTGGLCGRLDGSKINDWMSIDGSSGSSLSNFLSSWQAMKIGDVCTDPPMFESSCSAKEERKAAQFCDRLRTEKRFSTYLKLVDPEPYIEACKWDYCKCLSERGQNCGCESLNAFFKECSLNEGAVENGWRSDTFCPLECPKGFEYKSCMPAIQSRCGQAAESAKPEFCVEGCDCPPGTVLLDNKCIQPADCPCKYRNKTYTSWDIIPNDCNSCTCISGKWVCTEVKCGSRCSVIGDPHYKTFDGRRFDFMGKCSYYLVKGIDFHIEAENVPCSGAISQAMNFPVSMMTDFASCTKSITISAQGTTVDLRQRQAVFINGVEIRDLPVWKGGIFVKRASNIFIIATLPNGVEVWWDGQTSAYIDAPANMRDKISGLCGTFNDNQRDDFLTPEGDIEQDPTAFANKWKTMEKCSDASRIENAHPCDRHVQNKAVAEKMCAKLKSKVFAECHLEADPEPFYKNCLYDLCSCEEDISKCLCPMLAAYGKECTSKGITVDWRSKVRQCGMHCSGGQVYQLCGNNCFHTCADVTFSADCKKKCVEGCNCPEGFTLNSDKKCIPVNQCPCVYEAKEYKPQYEMFQRNDQGLLQACECQNARWKCRDPTDLEMDSPEFFALPQMQCADPKTEVYTDCMQPEELSCLNMHLRKETLPEICKAGCRCNDGYVRDPDTGRCIPYIDCPCHHGGRSYQDGDSIQEGCNTCICRQSVWACPTDPCPATCTAWGDSHYKTFDGRMYDFHGICDYMLAKGKLSKTDSFEVTVQNVPCGSSGVACAKSIALRVGAKDNQEVVEFSRNKPPPMKNMTRIIIREAGVFIYAEVADLGLVLQWDRGTRTYITLDPSWRTHVKGLCGNYNEDEKDDFQTPSGGSGEVSAKLFGDSWRLQNYCPDSLLIKDTCALHPHRKVWAAQQCALLKSDTFAACHSEVLVDPYVERCQFDSCGCDTGGDCHCLCTAIAAYAHECNKQGVYIKWRTPHLCPMQCDEKCEHYAPCIQTCPKTSCASYLEPKSTMCASDTCVEGCAKNPCPPGQVHKGPADDECVPKEDCDKTCLTIDDEVYFEGDIVSQDDCHTCYCLRQKKVCKGEPCATEIKVTTLGIDSGGVTTPDYSSTTPDTDECRTGWTEWINADHPIVYKKNSDLEPIPNSISKPTSLKGFCKRDMYAGIKCRTVGDHKGPSRGVTCDMETGLKCQGPKSYGKGSSQCKDYEISLLCDCSSTTPIIPLVSETVPPLVIPETTPVDTSVGEACDVEGWSPWMNLYYPDKSGEFESLENLRKRYTLCPDMFIDEVECRPVSGNVNKWTTCSKTGAICNNNNNRRSLCTDYEIRIHCQCFCDDLFGMDSVDKFPAQRFTASSSLSATTGPDRSRFNSGFAWMPSMPPGNDARHEWLQVDLGEIRQITGIVTKGLPSLGAYVKSFAIQFSDDQKYWDDVQQKDTSHAKIFTVDDLDKLEATNYFPAPIDAQYVRITPITYEDSVALQFDLKGCGETDTAPASAMQTTIQPKVCTNGWTPWMSSDQPHPGDWDDIENYENLRRTYSFCPEEMITRVDCRTRGTKTDIEDQIEVVCNKNYGLQCVDTLQVGHCHDYEIRFLCACQETTPATTFTTTQTPPSEVEVLCDPDHPTHQHESSCQKFLKCRPALFGGMEMVEENCGPGTLYNPDTGVCDWDFVVYKIRPECRDIKKTTTEATPPTSCTESYWSEWFNLSHPDTDGGDFETYEKIAQTEKSICRKEDIVEIQCQYKTESESFSKGGNSKGRKGGSSKKGSRSSPAKYRTSLLDSSASEDYGVTCTIDGGLECLNSEQPKWRSSKCQDYSVRLFCSCDKPTEPSAPVTTVSPEDRFTDIRTLIPDTSPFMYNDYWCPPGRYYEEFAIKCSMVCIYYKQLLVKHGKCLDDNEIAPACVEDVSGQACPPGFFLRSNSSCVSIHNCNCMLPNGLSSPPGKAFLVSDCEVCKCDDNELMCDNSQCYDQPEKTNCDDWTPWVSAATPSKEGEVEKLSALQLKNPDFCLNPSAIECRDRKTNLTPEELGQNVKCDLTDGLICQDWENIYPCADYEIRMKCPCDEESSPLPPVIALTTEDTKVLPECTEPFWTEWINMSDPKSNTGDYEQIEEIYAKGYPVCPKEYIKDIECFFTKEIKRKSYAKGKGGRRSTKGRPSKLTQKEWLPYTESDDTNVICSKDVGLICSNFDQRRFTKCEDYSIRILCSCEPTEVVTTPSSVTTEIVLRTPHSPTACDEGMILKSCATDCDQVCHSFKTTLQKEDRCMDENDCAPACLRPAEDGNCPEGLYRNEDKTCVRIEECSCTTDNGVILKPGVVEKISQCEVCSCFQNKLMCQKKANCITTTEELVVTSTISRNEVTPGAFTTEPPRSLVVLRCDEWTPWINKRRSKIGDFQELEDLKFSYPDLCDKPLNISCREANTKLAADELGQIITCDPEIGLICRDAENTRRCFDYEVSFFCECDPALSTPKPSVTEGVGLTTEVAPCDSWSPWINEHQPWTENGDQELKTPQQLRNEFAFCLEGEISDIECEESSSGLPTTMNKNVRCDTRFGLKCLNFEQDSRVCLDFRIRYFCSCEKSTTSRPVIFLTSTPLPSTICEEPNYINLLADVQDEGFSATSSQSKQYSPSDARLNDPRRSSGGAWIPSVSDTKQFLQIDLGDIQTIYGIYLSGSKNSKGRVTTFAVQVSDDEIAWSQVLPEVFRGPLTSDDTILVVLSSPVEGRFVKIIPKTWVEFIALRVEVLGCIEPSLATAKPTQDPTICTDEMGFENNQLSNAQIEVSSVLNDQPEFYGKNHIRLNSPVIPKLSAGAWVAKPSLKEFVRIDFVNTAKLSGIKTQGKDQSDAWMESFAVRYSPDGKVWSYIKDPQTLEDKIFVANYDSATVVDNPFSRILETRFLEIIPRTWHNQIALRLEIVGCYHPYPEVTTTFTSTEPTVTPPDYCDVCLNLPAEYMKKCIPCSWGEKFDGRNCVPEVLCPCYHEGNRYDMGAEYETSDCEECKCDFNGVTACEKIVCPRCEEEDERPVLTSSCSCLCKPCAYNSTLCPTDDVCIEDDKWCDGIMHCHDDELDCAPEETGCPEPECPADWELITHLPDKLSSCPTFECIAPPMTTASYCSPPMCPPEYDIVLELRRDSDMCPKYSCVAPPTTVAPVTCPSPACPKGYDVELAEPSYEQYSQSTDYDQDSDGCLQYRCFTNAPPTAPCPPPYCPDSHNIEYASPSEMLQLCPMYECVPFKITTTCPRVQCPADLQTMYVDSNDTCPQYTCIKVTTPTPLTDMTPLTPCDDVVLPMCQGGEEIYQSNPNDRCPVFKCKKIGEMPTTIGSAAEVPGARCTVKRNEFTTFDGDEFRHEVCDHVMARDKIDKDWQITIHTNCSQKENCPRYLRITQQDQTIELDSNLSIKLGKHLYSVSQAKKIGKTTETFSLSQIGNSVAFISSIYKFTVIWDTNMDATIEVTNDHLYQVDGLCGFYTGSPLDDRTKPDGSLAKTTREFVKSWSLKDEVCSSTTTKCSNADNAKALQTCSIVESKTFADCHDVVSPLVFMKSCVDRLCHCLEGNKTEEECKCNILSSYTTACLEKKPTAAIANWRIDAKCYKECPNGEEYHDCYQRACEPSCGTSMDSHTCDPLESAPCVSGCFCEPGLIRKDEACVLPEVCRDCVCEAYGDPHYKSFDRKNFTFNGECSYVAARDADPTGRHSFQVTVENKRCQNEPVMMCTTKVNVLYADHQVSIYLLPTNALVVEIDEIVVQQFPSSNDWLAIEKLDDSQISLVVKQVQLEVTYKKDYYGFTIKVPSHLYGGKMEGLCGNCNDDTEDDFVTRNGEMTESIDEFGLSWLVDTDSDSCAVFDKSSEPCLPQDPSIDPCLELMDENVFGKCHILEDPVAYLSSCQLDYCISKDSKKSACQSLEAYARRCGQLGVCLDWRTDDRCPKECDEGLEYLSCGPGCLKTCDNYETFDKDPSACLMSSADGCYCKDGKVLENGTCIDAVSCTVCDNEGHRFGDNWKPDVCTNCTCSETGGTNCRRQSCSPEPVCNAGYIATEVPGVSDPCCGPQKMCTVKPLDDCPVLDDIAENCGFGKKSKTIESPGICPERACVCLEASECPPLSLPDEDKLKTGEQWVLDSKGCCDRYVRECTGLCPEPDCPAHHIVKKNPKSETDCCHTITCEPPTDACIYEKTNLLKPDSQKGQRLTSKESETLFKIGEKWSDGLCTRCECTLDQKSKPYAKCVEESCQDLENHPDIKDYVLAEIESSVSCCPEIRRNGCIDDGDEIQVNETYYDPTNGCRSVECKIGRERNIEKVEKVYSCEEDCPLGWLYEPSPMYPQVCCGDCQQVACEHDGSLRNVGDTWSSIDFCTEFKCAKIETSGKILTQSKEKQCQIPSAADKEKYTYEETRNPGECCSNFTATACLIGEQIISPGTELPDPDDKCIAFSCEIKETTVVRREKEKACNMDCPLGYIYVNAQETSSECCGRCIQTQCVDNDVLHPVGDTWENPEDICFQYSCQIRDGPLTIVAIKRECPYFDPSCPTDEIISDKTGCCRLCNITRETKKECQPELIEPAETMGMFVLEAKSVGKCTNFKPVEGFRRCNGQCDSKTVFVAKATSADHISECDCCRPSKFSQIKVPLRCEQGYTFDRVFVNIEACQCQKCSGGQGGRRNYLNDQPIADETQFHVPLSDQELSNS